MAVAVKSDEGRLEDEGTLGGPKFDPPLYLQRYNAVIEVARRTQARKVQWQSRMLHAGNVLFAWSCRCGAKSPQLQEFWEQWNKSSIYNLYNNELGNSGCREVVVGL